jgi:cytochrome c peroxidase
MHYEVVRSTRRAGQVWKLLWLAAAVAGCEENTLGGSAHGFSEQEWNLVLELEPLKEPPPPSPFNEYWNNDAAARLGHRMFFDPTFATAIKVEGPSGKVGDTAKVSCATCHSPGAYFADPRPGYGLSHGTSYTSRNSPGLVNVAYYEWFNWDGRRDSLAAQGGGTLETGTNGASTRLQVAHIVYDKYKADYEALFGPLPPALSAAAPDASRFPANGRPKASGAADGPWEMMAAEDRAAVTLIMANVGKLFEAYERRLVSDNSPFKQYLHDQDVSTFSGAARRGLQLFIGKAACNECHRGPILSDNKFHNVGVQQAYGPYTPALDEGRSAGIAELLNNAYRTSGTYSSNPQAGEAKLAEAMALSQNEVAREPLRGAFRTPGLLNVAKTAPYFHNGSAQTLHEVVEHYNRGGGGAGTFAGTLDAKVRPLLLTAAEVDDLVAFLISLTGEPVAEEWARNPLQ